jgi:FKBP-type peptidyl-prolyl cis-trans isomerase FkpA
MRLLVVSAFAIVLVSCSSSPSPDAQKAINDAVASASAAAAAKPAPAAPADDPFLTKAAAEPGAVKTASGLVYKELRAGTGPSPTATDTVKVNYRGMLTNGTEFDSSYKTGKPATFPLNGVIPCWTEGVAMMKVGGKAQLVCPASIAYGANSPPPIPPNSTLVFQVELLGIGG